MQDRERECGGFAGTGLCDADHVAARHDRRYRLRLDRRRSLVFFLREGAQKRFVEFKGGEGAVKFAVCVSGQDIAFYLWDAKPAGARCAPADLRVGKDIPRDLGCQ